jgi:chemotaxis protein MotB
MIRHRKKRPIDNDNHERWLISYADFVTLLFAFFVVMYSISAVNEEKYKAFSDSLETAFYEKKEKIDKVEPAQASTQSDVLIPISPAPPAVDETVINFDPAEEKRQLQLVSEQLTTSLDPLINENMVSIKKNDFWIELELNSELLFLSGEAELAASSKPVLKKIADVFKTLPNAINVEGHTDNHPIKTIKFPSNWELSSARATRVVQEFAAQGIDSARLSAIGYGEYHPIADNTLEKGRFKNRRVVLLLVSKGLSRYGTSDQDRASLLKQLPVDAISGSVK